MSWYIRTRYTGHEDQRTVSVDNVYEVGHYAPDGTWVVLVPFSFDHGSQEQLETPGLSSMVRETEEAAYRLVSFLNGSSTPYMLVTMDEAETEYTTGDIYEVLTGIRDGLKKSNSMYEHFCEWVGGSGIESLLRAIHAVADSVDATDGH